MKSPLSYILLALTIFSHSPRASAAIVDPLSSLRCIGAANSAFGSAGYQPNAGVLVSNGTLFAAMTLDATISDRANKALAPLLAAGDGDLPNRHVCVGMYPFQTFNAFSSPAGAIGIDPSVHREFNETLKERTMASFDQVILHELAHQFQFWYGNSFLSDANVRRSELTADCIGSALNGLLWRQSSLYGWEQVRAGVIESARQVGDAQFEDQKHHGTRIERMQAAWAGINLVEKTKLTSAKGLLLQCEMNIRTLH